MNFFFDHVLADGGANSLEMWKGEILDQVRIKTTEWQEKNRLPLTNLLQLKTIFLINF